LRVEGGAGGVGEGLGVALEVDPGLDVSQKQKCWSCNGKHPLLYRPSCAMIINLEDRMKKATYRILLAAAIFLFASPWPRPATAQMSEGVCSFTEKNGTRLLWRKKCTLDSFNSGNISFITNNGTMWFMLNDSRNGSYKYNGKIWYATDSFCAAGCSFKRGANVFTYSSLASSW